MKIFEFDQYSDSWWSERRGRPSASEFGSIITPKTGELSKEADTYIFRLLGDLYDVEYPRKDTIATAAMRRGTELEGEARSYLEMHEGVDVKQVGGILSECGRFWSSPDGLIGDDEILELKCPLPATHVKWLVAGTLPCEHRPQCSGHLIVSGRKRCVFVSYCPGFPPLIVRQAADDFTKKLGECLEAFDKRYREIKEKIAALSGVSQAA